MPEESGGSIETKKWYQNTKAMISLISVLLATLLFPLLNFLGVKPTDLFKSKSEAPAHVVEIVLDASNGMNEPFENNTKFEAAKQAVKARLDLVTTEKDHLALLTFGGVCGEKNYELKVPFGEKHEEKVRAALDKIQLQGETALLSAIAEAIAHLKQDRFKSAGKTLIVITGNSDVCYPDVDIEKFILEKISGVDSIQLDFQDVRMVGLGLSSEQAKEQLNQLAAATGGVALFPNRQSELTQAVGTREQSSALLETQKTFDAAKRLYDRGDYETARPLFEKSAQNNFAEAMTYLGNIYYYGLSSKCEDWAAAESWYRKGAEGGDSHAMVNLGLMYSYGHHVEKDYKQALSLFDKAAKRGNAEAMTLLGLAYEKGEGVPPNRQTAIDWYRQAAARGDKNAQKYLAKLAN